MLQQFCSVSLGVEGACAPLCVRVPSCTHTHAQLLFKCFRRECEGRALEC